MNATDFKPGDRVKLVKMDDPYRKDVPIGMLGTVVDTCPPPLNVVDVRWDNGFSLNPCLDLDVIVKVSEKEV